MRNGVKFGLTLSSHISGGKDLDRTKSTSIHQGIACVMSCQLSTMCIQNLTLKKYNIF